MAHLIETNTQLIKKMKRITDNPETHEDELVKQLELFKSEILYKVINPYMTEKEGDCVFENPPEIQNGKMLIEDLIFAINQFNGDPFNSKLLAELAELIDEDTDVYNYVTKTQSQVKMHIFNELIENVETNIDSAENESLNQAIEKIKDLYENAKSAFCRIFHIVKSLKLKK